MTPAKITTLFFLAFGLLVPAGLAAAQTSPATMIADGRPWTSVNPQGRAMTVTFYPDGTAKAKFGIFRKSLTWTPTEDGLCLYGTPRGDACMTLNKTETGYEGTKNGQVMIQLSR